MTRDNSCDPVRLREQKCVVVLKVCLFSTGLTSFQIKIRVTTGGWLDDDNDHDNDDDDDDDDTLFGKEK